MGYTSEPLRSTFCYLETSLCYLHSRTVQEDVDLPYRKTPFSGWLHHCETGHVCDT